MILVGETFSLKDATGYRVDVDSDRYTIVWEATTGHRTIEVFNGNTSRTLNVTPEMAEAIFVALKKSLDL